MTKNRTKLVYVFLLMLVMSTFSYGFTLINQQGRDEKQGEVGTKNGDKLWNGYNTSNGLPMHLIKDTNRFDVSNIAGITKDIFKDKNNSSIVDGGNIASNILTMEDNSELWITFVAEDAGYKNTLAYYTYKKEEKPSSINSANLIFPNIDNNRLKEGNTVYLGEFEKDTVIGWVLFSDGWKKPEVNVRKPKLFSNKEWNTKKLQQMALMEFVEEGKQKLVLAVEDTERPNGDKDFNDLIFCVTSNKRLLPENGEFISDEWTAFSVKGKIKLFESSYIEGLTGTNANDKIGSEKPIAITGTSWIGQGGKADYTVLKTGYNENEAFYSADDIIYIPEWWQNGSEAQKNFRLAVKRNRIQKLGAFYKKEINKEWLDIDIPSDSGLEKFGEVSSGVINKSGSYTSISVRNELSVNVGDNDIILVIDKLKISGNGKISVNRGSGKKGKLFLVINNSADISGTGLVSDMDDIYIYYMGEDEFKINGDSELKASLYIHKANLDLSGSAKLIGKEVITKGSLVKLSGSGTSLGKLYALNADIYLSGSSEIKGILTGGSLIEVKGGTGTLEYIYAPKASVNLLSSAKVKGFVIAGDLNLTGTSYIKKGNAKLVEPEWPSYNNPPVVDIINPTEDTLILENKDIEIKANINDLNGDKVTVKLYLNGEYVEGSQQSVAGNGVYSYSIKTNDDFKNKEYSIKLVAVDDNGASSRDEVLIYIPDDRILLNINNPIGTYLQIDKGIVVEFEVKSNYKKKIEGKVEDQDLKAPVVVFVLESGEIFSSDNSSYGQVFQFSSENVDNTEYIVDKKYKLKIQADTHNDSIYQKIISQKNINLKVEVESEDEEIKVEETKNLKISKPRVDMVSIKNLTSKSFFEFLVDEKGNKIYSGTNNNFYEETINSVGTYINSKVFIKKGDKLQFVIKYADEYLKNVSIENIKKRINISSSLIEVTKFNVSKSSNMVEVVYEFVFKGFSSENFSDTEFGVTISDVNGGKADLSKIKININNDSLTSKITLSEGNIYEGNNYIGPEHSLQYKFDEVNNVAAYLVVFDYDWTQSDLEKEPSTKPNNNYQGDRYYFATKSSSVDLNNINKIDGLYKVSIIPIGFAGNNFTGKGTFTEILNSLTDSNFKLSYYVDQIAPKVKKSEILKTKEGTYEDWLVDFGFVNGVIDERYYKFNDYLEAKLEVSENNLNKYTIRIKGDFQSVKKISDNKVHILETPEFRAGEDRDEVSYSLEDKAGNKTMSKEGSLIVELDREEAGKAILDGGILSSGIRFLSDNIYIKNSGLKPEFVIATSDKSARTYGAENPKYLKDFKDKEGVLFLPIEGRHDIDIYSFSRAGKMKKEIETAFIDKDINYDGVLKEEDKILYRTDGKYTVTLDFDDITEYVGLKNYKIINSNGITGDVSKNLTTKNGPSLSKIGGVKEKPIISFEHNIPSNKVLKIKFVDKLGNEKTIEYQIQIGSRINIIGKKSGSNKVIESRIEINNISDIEIKSRK